MAVKTVKGKKPEFFPIARLIPHVILTFGTVRRVTDDSSSAALRRS